MDDADRAALPSVGTYRAKDGSTDRATIVETNIDALITRLHMIRSAQREVLVTTFDIRADNSGTDVIAALFAAADRGVRVRLLTDGQAELLRMRSTPEFHALAQHPNVEIKAYSPPSGIAPWTIFGRYHDKIVVVDDRLLLLGGRNTYDFFLGGYPTDHPSGDRETLVYAPDGTGTIGGPRTSVIPEVRRYADAVWYGPDAPTVLTHLTWGMSQREVDVAAAGLRSHAAAQEANDPTVLDDAFWRGKTMAVDRVTLLGNPSHPGTKKPVVWTQLMALADTARTDVVLQTPYYVANRAMTADVARLTQRPGRRVRLILNSAVTGDNVVASGDYRYARPDVLATGAEVWEFFGPDSSHAKSTAIDDDLSVIGSFNLDQLSAYGNTESVLVIAGKDFNAALRGHMDAAFAEAARVKPDGTYDTPSGEAPRPLPARRAVMLRILGVVTWPFRFLL
ncbi:phospholipase D-like domain-containing protein [Nigerium massiliense]|uniref:phospholipase D-like domain-containing protein n=1 Tax=Nigerium massiliense TaxID=1522317 RepID=UPI00059145BC|nr:phospholipase D-like domain-containing protein [Nigerium massiliense]